MTTIKEFFRAIFYPPLLLVILMGRILLVFLFVIVLFPMIFVQWLDQSFHTLVLFVIALMPVTLFFYSIYLLFSWIFF